MTTTRHNSIAHFAHPLRDLPRLGVFPAPGRFFSAGDRIINCVVCVMMWVVLTAVALALLSLAGCGARPLPPSTGPQPNDIQTDIMRQLATARERLGDVTAAVAVPIAQLDIGAIRMAVARADDSLVNAERAAAKLAGVQVGADAAAKRIAELESKLVDQQRRVMGWVWGIMAGGGLIGVGLGIFMLLSGNKLGIAIAGGAGAIGLGAAILPPIFDAAGKASALVVWTVGGTLAALVLFGAGLLAWSIWRNRDWLNWFVRETSNEAIQRLGEKGQPDAAGALTYLQTGGDRAAAKVERNFYVKLKSYEAATGATP